MAPTFTRAHRAPDRAPVPAFAERTEGATQPARAAEFAPRRPPAPELAAAAAPRDGAPPSPAAFREPRRVPARAPHKHAPKSLAALVATAALELRTRAEPTHVFSEPLTHFNATASFAAERVVLNPRKLAPTGDVRVYKLSEHIYVQA